MIEIKIYTPDAAPVGLPPEFRSDEAFDHEIENHQFGSPYAAALFLLGRCDLMELRDLALYQLRTLQRTASDRPHVVAAAGPWGRKRSRKARRGQPTAITGHCLCPACYRREMDRLYARKLLAHASMESH